MCSISTVTIDHNVVDGAPRRASVRTSASSSNTHGPRSTLFNDRRPIREALAAGTVVAVVYGHAFIRARGLGRRRVDGPNDRTGGRQRFGKAGLWTSSDAAAGDGPASRRQVDRVVLHVVDGSNGSRRSRSTSTGARSDSEQ